MATLGNEVFGCVIRKCKMVFLEKSKHLHKIPEEGSSEGDMCLPVSTKCGLDAPIRAGTS